jgi:hypothetical protein
VCVGVRPSLSVGRWLCRRAEPQGERGFIFIFIFIFIFFYLIYFYFFIFIRLSYYVTHVAHSIFQFFVVFLFWSSLYLTYTLTLLIATLVSRANPSHPITFTTPSLDPNIVALLIVTILFLAFSAGMFGTHVHLLRHNASTVEWHGVQEMKERERAVISQLVPVCECLGMGRGERGNGGLLGWKDEEVGLPVVRGVSSKGFKGRVELMKKWNDEWGRIGKEGHLWWWVFFSFLGAYLYCPHPSFSSQARIGPCQLGGRHGQEPVDLVLSVPVCPFRLELELTPL